MYDPASQLATIMPTGLTGSIVRTEGLTAAVAGFPSGYQIQLQPVSVMVSSHFHVFEGIVEESVWS